MSFSFGSMIRLMAVLAVGATLLAISVSRLAPPQAPRRFPRPVTSYNINDFYFQAKNRQSRWIDSETGTLSVMPFPSDDIVEATSTSPWVDESGHRQAVGRWSNRTWRGPGTICHEFGLARFSMPDGRMLNQVPADIVPVGPPCWLPGTQARIVFTAGDGRLYRFAFEAETPDLLGDSSESADARPSVLTWRCPRPGQGDVFISDLAWPEDPRLGGRLIASMRLNESGDGEPMHLTRTQLYWLKLNHSATEIIEVGPLLDHDVSRSAASRLDERSPTVASLADGTLGLAYTRQSADESHWSVYLAPLSATADHVVPARESRSRVVIARSQPGPLSFSSNGKWLNALVGDLDSKESVARVPTLP